MGASVVADPRYQALAAEISAGIGGGPNTTRAILAQMACEKAGEWPPADNNPLNVHSSALASVGITSGYTQGSGDFGAVARFPSPDAGAAATARFIVQGPRWALALQAARRDDGAAYLRAITSAGWGTSYSCAAGYYGGNQAVSGSNPPAGSTSGSAVSPSVADWLGIPGSTVLTQALAQQAAVKYALAQTKGSVGPAYQYAVNSIYTGLQPWIGTPAGQVPFNVTSSGGNTSKVVVPSPADQGSGNTQRGSLLDLTPLANAIAGLPAALGQIGASFAVDLVILLAIVIMAYKGFSQLVDVDAVARIASLAA